MAANKRPSIQRSISVKFVNNLESFACLWLDQNIDSTQGNRDTQKELRHVINHLRTFDNSDECEKYIRQINQEKVILIVSGSLGQEIVPRLQDLPQLSACYVFCQDKKRNEEWANKYPKVHGVFVERHKLVIQISKDQVARGKVEDGPLISVINSGTQSLQTRNAIFMWFQLFIEVLLRMHHKSSDRKELLDLCKKDYEGNQQEMSIIDEFEKNYKPEDAIWWYTRESCFYRMMNKALRVQDFDKLFALRFLIADIAKQIRNEYEKFIRTSDTRNLIRVYRGQLIGNDELELMKNSIGEFLSMNSFLSTSRSRSTSLDFVRSTPITDGLQRIIFEIEIDPCMHTKAFADITKTSYFQNEDEVLIMLGALFRIEKVIEDKNDGLWVIHVSLASEDDYKLKETFSYMKSTIGDDTDFNTLGKILIDMGQYEQAQKCYQRMIDQTTLILGNAEYGLGKTHLDLEEVDESLKHFLKALEMRQRVLGEHHADVGECYNSIGMAYLCARNEHENALSHLKKAVEIQEKTLSSDSLSLSETYGNIATIYIDMGKDDLALTYYNRALKIQEKVLPSDHPDIAATYNHLGDSCVAKQDYSKALEYYQKSLEISRKTLPPDHPSILGTETEIRYAKEKMNKNSNNSIK